MGCSSSKAAAPPSQAAGKKKAGYKLNDDEMKTSLHGGKGGTRKNFVWVRENTPMTDVYDVLEIVGQGSMGEVTIVARRMDTLEKVTTRHHKNTNDSKSGQVFDVAEMKRLDSEDKIEAKKARRFACKTINTVRFNDKEIEEFINEIDILRELDHPNIVQLFEVYHIKRKMWIITELCTGGDLTPHMGKLEESEVAIIIEQVMRAIFYMHKRNVCHRDIKLENILFASEDPESPIKLIDFGLSNQFTKGLKMLKACGTVYTAAPEVLLPGHGYTEQTDIWSIGVITYVLLSGEYPFMKGIDEMADDVKKSNLEYARYEFGPDWDKKGISEDAREFIGGCVRRNPGSRWIAKRCLDFVSKTWIPNLEASHKGDAEKEKALSRSVRAKSRQTRLNQGVVEGMNDYVLYGEFKKTILMTMAYTMDKSNLKELSDMFLVIDSTGTGTVSLAELKQALAGMHTENTLDDETIEKLFHGIDVDSTGQIHYNEFLAAVVESQGLITMEHLAGAFDRLDKDGKGYISKDDLRDLLGSDYNAEKVNRMIDEADYKKNGQVDYDEFLRLMFGNPEQGMKAIGTTKFAEDVKMAENLATLEAGGRIASVRGL